MRCEKFWTLNTTRDVCLASETETARSIFRRMKGLIGGSSRSFSPGMGLWIAPSMGIHTIGMRFTIDAAYLDSENRVLRLYHRLPPFRVAALTRKAQSVLELPAGTLAQTQTEVGDILRFIPHSSVPQKNVSPDLSRRNP